MRDYEELVKSLRICADSADPISECCFSDCCEHDEPIDPLCMGQLIHMAADAIEELSKPKWISVEDDLPKNELETYWVYTSVGSQHSCRWTNNRFGLGVSDKWGWSVFDIPQYTVVTHWMPLPQAPKEET